MENVRKAVEALTKSKTEVLALLAKDNVGEIVSIGISTKFDQMINSLSFITGDFNPGTPNFSFEPITTFMGEKLETPVVVVAEQLEPTKDDTTAYVEKVDALQKNFPALENNKILESYVTLTDVLVLRGVAKRAGLEDFREAEINSIYIDKIREGLKAKDAAKAFEDRQNANINK